MWFCGLRLLGGRLRLLQGRAQAHLNVALRIWGLGRDLQRWQATDVAERVDRLRALPLLVRASSTCTCEPTVPTAQAAAAKCSYALCRPPHLSLCAVAPLGGPLQEGALLTHLRRQSELGKMGSR